MKTKPNKLDRLVTLALKPHDAAVLLGALGALQLVLGEREPVMQDTISRVILQLRLMQKPPDEAKKAPYPL